MTQKQTSWRDMAEILGEALDLGHGQDQWADRGYLTRPVVVTADGNLRIEWNDNNGIAHIFLVRVLEL